MAQTPVRPTRRCLAEMGLSVPFLTEPLHELEHSLLSKAQQLPAQHGAGGAERVLCLTDRLWFKVKIGRSRGAATLLSDAEIDEQDSGLRDHGRWWLRAFGHREDGSRVDFYTALEADAEAHGRGGKLSTAHLLPQDWDWTRLRLERTEAWRRTMRELVLTLIARSIRTGNECCAELRHHRISALVRAENGHDAYLAIVAEGVPDAKVIAAILGSVPGVPSEDWLPDPDGPGNRHAGPGEIVWSTILPPESTATILDAVPDTN